MEETENQPTEEDLSQLQKNFKDAQPPLLDALDHLLKAPEIPYFMKKQFHALWNTTIFGNYNEKDISLLNAKFEEWCILLKWYIPEQHWGNILAFQDSPDEDSPVVQMDLSQLINSLQTLFYINLTRGRNGFTVKQMTTFRNITKLGSEDEKKKSGWRLF